MKSLHIKNKEWKNFVIFHIRLDFCVRIKSIDQKSIDRDKTKRNNQLYSEDNDRRITTQSLHKISGSKIKLNFHDHTDFHLLKWLIARQIIQKLKT